MNNKKRYLKEISTFAYILTTAVMLLSFIAAPVWAGVYDGSQSKYLSRLIDHTITLERTAIIENRIENSKGTDQTSINRLKEFAGKTIFWIGRVEKFQPDKSQVQMLIHIPGTGRFWASADTSVKNIDFDRTGYRVGIKGNMVLKNNRLHYVKASSVVLMSPPDELSYHTFKNKHNLSESFIINTREGRISITHKHYPFILHRIYIHNPNYSWQTIEQIGKSIVFYADRFGLDPLLLTALINIESAFDVDAVSVSGALGLGQLMPGTAAALGVDPYDTVQNIGGAARYLSRQMRRWQGHSSQTALALACYNAGPGAVDYYGGVPPYSETRNYVFFINHMLKEYETQFLGR